MMDRRWFVTKELLQWKHMQACGDYAGPFFSFPNHPSGIDPWEQGRNLRNFAAAYGFGKPETLFGFEA